MSLVGNAQSLAHGRLANDGFEVAPQLLPHEECDALARELSSHREQQTAPSKNKFGGLRNLLRSSPSVAELASSRSVIDLLDARGYACAFPARVIFFDKTPLANWSVAWHQDLSIAVAEKIETAGYEAWSMKEGVVHVQPPVKILEGMVTVRLHLDECMSENGPLKVVPGSHRRGKLKSDQISRDENERNAFICEIPKGGASLMRPLLLHASSSAKLPSHRRVVHIEYATTELDNGLKWHAW